MIFTSNDARKEKNLADANREHAALTREAKAKVRKWERKVAKFGGEVQVQTLARMKANLESIA